MYTAMPKSRNILAGGLLLLLLAPALAQGFTFLAGSPVEKPADPGFVYNRTVFDCLPPDSLTITIGSATTLSDSTLGRANVITGYPCAPWSETGPELVYRVDIAAPMQLHARLQIADPLVDLDLFLLGDCDSDSCLVGANTEFTAELEAGIHYLVVDGANGAAGLFDLVLTSRPLGLPDSICEPGGATEVVCGDSTIEITGESLFEQPDLLRSYACGTSPKTAGEIWYAVTLPPERDVVINVVNVQPVFDTCLWVFTSCGPTAQCDRFVDANLAGSGESVTLTNETTGDLVWYVAVDAVRPPTSELLGGFDIQFQCQSNVPTAKTSFGGLKSLYR